MVLGQNPGREEEAQGRPFVGKTGQMQETAFFPLAGLQRSHISIGNAIRCRLDEGNRLPPLESREVRDAIAHCSRAYLRPPTSTRLVIAQGEYALWTATGEGLGPGNGIADWRGWLLPWAPGGLVVPPRPRHIWTPGPSDMAVLASYHLAFLFRDPKMKAAVQRDWCKVPLILRGSWPATLPSILPTPPAALAGRWAFDSEWDPATGKLLCYSLYGGEREPTLHVVDGAEHLAVAGRPHIVFHNAQADLDNFERVSGLPWGSYDVDDTMYAHAALWGGFPHDLEHLGSLYARINRWKHLQHENALEYSAGDALGTWDVWHALEAEFARDPASRAVYAGWQLPLIPIIRRAHAAGMALHQERVHEALTALDAVRLDQTLRAQVAVGWPINVGSQQQVGYQLYQVEKLGSTRAGSPSRRRSKRAG